MSTMRVLLRRLTQLALIYAAIRIRRNVFLRKSLYVLFRVIVEKITNGADARRNGFILNRNDITSEWLEAALQEKFPKVKVRSVGAEVMGDDMGNASEMYKLRVEYAMSSGGGAGVPGVIVLKTPKNDLKNRVPFTATRMTEMEARFYGFVEESLRDVELVHVPRSFGNKVNDDGNMYVLMEDVTASGATFLTEKEEFHSLEKAKQAVKGIAMFHAPFWDSPRLAEGGDLHDPIIGQLDPVLNMTETFMKAAWPRTMERMRGNIPDEVIARGSALIQVVQRLHDSMAVKPNTICHGDCHLENAYLYPAKNELGWEIGFYDFQLLRRGNGAIDLATFLCGSCAPGLFACHETELLTCYMDTIAEARWFKQGLHYVVDTKEEPYTLEHLKHDFRLALGLVFCWNVAAGMAVPFDTDAADHYYAYFTRLCQAVHDLDIINYCLVAVGGHQAEVQKRVKQSGMSGLRGGSPTWDVPPVLRLEVNEDLPHKKYGYETFKAEYRLLKAGLHHRLLHALKYRFMLRMTSSRSGHHGQKTTGIPDAVLEGHHPVKYAVGTPVESSAFDSYYISAFAPFGSSSPSCALRICKRAQDDKGEIWLIIKTADDIYTWAEHPSTTCRVVYEGERAIIASSLHDNSAMKFTCVEPMKAWRAAFRGKLRSTASGALVDASFDLKWTRAMKTFSFGTDVSPELTARALALETFSKEFFDELKAAHQEHYEQFGRVTGSVELDGKVLQMKCKGMRDRAFGMRDWGYMQRYFSSYFWCGAMENGDVYNVTMASLPTLSNAKFGFINKKENIHRNMPVNAMSADLSRIAHDGCPPSRLCLAFVAGEGDQKVTYYMELNVGEGDTVPLNMGPERMLVNFRFARYCVSWIDPESGDDMVQEGFGASEFGYRFKGVVPMKPSLEDLQFLPVTGDEPTT